MISHVFFMLSCSLCSLISAWKTMVLVLDSALETSVSNPLICELSFWISFLLFWWKPWRCHGLSFFPCWLTKIQQNFPIYRPAKQLPECVEHLQAQSEKCKSGKRNGWNKTFESRPSSHTVRCVLLQRNEHLQSPGWFAGTYLNRCC